MSSKKSLKQAREEAALFREGWHDFTYTHTVSKATADHVAFRAGRAAAERYYAMAYLEYQRTKLTAHAHLLHDYQKDAVKTLVEREHRLPRFTDSLRVSYPSNTAVAAPHPVFNDTRPCPQCGATTPICGC